VSCWVDLALGQGEFPRDPSLKPCKVGEVVKGQDSTSMGFMTYKGL
jgi:hypothetical protein